MKYALPDLERRWRALPGTVPGAAQVLPAEGRLIEDHYLDGTRMRLRRVTDPDGTVARKLTKKYAPAAATKAAPATPHASTNLYLDEAEYALLATLPGKPLRKRRHHREHAGVRYAIDVFEGALAGLVLTEVECADEAALAAVVPPPWAGAEVSDDPAFTGAALARSDANTLARILADAP
jgi:CYTH domain-containing protein